jgi:putative flippase GtrA
MRQFIKYAVVGLATNVAGYLLYLLVTYLGAAPKVAMTVLYLLGAIAGFYGNRVWTFSHQGRISASFLKYMATHCVGYLINLSLLTVLVDRLGWPHQGVQAFAIVVVALFLFMMFKWFVFPPQAPPAEVTR